MLMLVLMVMNVTFSGKIVLLLHGAAFTSQTWIDKVDTIRTLAGLGHKYVIKQ